MSEGAPEKTNVWSRFNKALTQTRSNISESLGNIFLGTRTIDDSVLDDLEMSLLVADVGARTTHAILDKLRKQVSRRQLNDHQALKEALRVELLQITDPMVKPFEITENRPFVVLVVGVNGAGKTTTIGKLAHWLKQDGHSILLAAGDTYRAAAVEQLQRWGDSNDVPVVSKGKGSDSASVIHDAMQTARARSIDILLADTAGRLQSKSGLMAELAKVKRVINRLDSSAPHQCVLVLDATVGQNALSQVREFDKAIGLTGLILTKLDGTAKGGVILALPSVTRLPLYFVGLGEGLDTLQSFDSKAYVEGLLAT